MFAGQITLFSYILHLTSCDWATEWMSPVQDQLQPIPSRRIDYNGGGLFNDDNIRMVPVVESTERFQSQIIKKYGATSPLKQELTTTNLKTKLENTLSNAKKLAETLKAQIQKVTARESLLKEAIVNGRSGTSTVLVSMLDRPPRSYVVRDGVWTQCRGVIRVQPRSTLGFEDFSAAPKCIGREVASPQDPCVFNSLIKYETLPTVRRLEYVEDDYLCLKTSFNSTLERYMSVPRQIIGNTCQNGTVRSLEENIQKCGLRVMSEYTYYPSQSSDLPLEYCSEPGGACKFIMAWHVSNSTIENFEFLKNEQAFNKYFIKSVDYAEHVI